MPKTIKKTTTKKPTKKADVKKVVKVAPVAAEIPVPEHYCQCTKRKRNTILTCVFTGAFLLGFFTYHLFFCPHHPHFKQNIQFENGCVKTETVKCPKMLEELPMIDADHDGCITKAELRAAKKSTRHHKRPAPVEEPAVVDAIAPVME